MALMESAFLSKVGTSLASGIAKKAGGQLARKLRTSEREKALKRCAQAAVEALVEEGFPGGTNTPRDHLESVLGQFGEDESVHGLLARAIREGRLAEGEVARLRGSFEETHPLETLPGFDPERGIAAFVAAFVGQADEEAAFQDLIQTKALRAQTRSLADLLAAARAQIEIQREIQGRPPDPRAQEETARRKYLEELRRRCLVLPVTRLLGDEGREEPLTLERVYVELDTKSPKEEPKGGTESPVFPGPRPYSEKEDRISALEALTAADSLVLLGEAGSGKSTFVRSVFAELAASGLSRSAKPPAGLARDLLPVFIVLRELSGRLQPLPLEDLSGEKRTRALAEAVRDQVLADLAEEQRAGAFREGLDEALDRGGCVLAFDGLDEVPEELRGRVREAVLAARGRFRPAKTLVTCRVRSYGAGFSLPGFTAHELAPFDEEKIRRFCAAWYGAQGALGRVPAQKVDPGAEDLARAVLDPTLRDLAGNPLLLTTMAIIHTRKAQLPKGRAQVFEDAIQLLVRDWQREKVGERLVPSQDLQGLLLDDARLWPLLERLAYEAHRVGGTEREVAAGLPEGDVLTLLKRTSLGSAAVAEEFLRYADQRAGLLVGLGGEPGQPAAFGFVHRTFQEYLAGRYLTRGRSPVDRLFAHAADGDLWSLAVEQGAEGLLHVDRNPEALLDLAYGLGNAHRRDSPRWRRAILWGAKMAALVGREAVERDQEGAVDGAVFLQDLRPKLVEILGSDLPPVERAEAGRALARLGDPREEVLRVDAMELCRVPAGRFLMGNWADEADAWDDERPQHELDLPYEYWIGRYPVTQAQFEEFIKDGGYGEARFWPEAMEHGVWEAGRIVARHEDEPTAGPARYGDPWDLPNHPAGGVTWYEALAFCRWLTARWQRQGWLPAGWEVRLPSEAEWEKAARGGLEVLASSARRRPGQGWDAGAGERSALTANPAPERPYPWRGGFENDRANTLETGIGTTSAVGCFPGSASASGCEELVGNVWEWTRSLEAEYPYPESAQAREAREKLSSDGPRVLRGSSILTVAWVARCSARFRIHPNDRGRITGFRLLLSPFSSDP
jgi:formylglycine-generating enzyme required for sulfatase activity